MDKKLMAQGVALLLRGMGCDLKDGNFRDTPMRVAKLYEEMCTPQANNWATFPHSGAGMIILRGHKVFAVCPHHLMPVELKAYVAYIPKKKVLGLSKLARAVEQHLTLPIIQEELGDRTASSLEDALDPQGVAVVLAGAHGCMRYRGIETDGDVVTSAMRGLFLHSQTTREEFLRLIGRP